jgi:hypothetical protein
MTQHPHLSGQPHDNHNHRTVPKMEHLPADAQHTQPLQLPPLALPPRPVLTTPPTLTAQPVFTPSPSIQSGPSFSHYRPSAPRGLPDAPPAAPGPEYTVRAPQSATGWRGVLEVPVEPIAAPVLASQQSIQSQTVIAQYAVLIMGIIWSVTGGIALARLSMGGDSITVAGMGFTSICGWGAVVVGIMLTLIGACASRDRSVLLAAATLLLVPGLVVASVPDAFTTLLGATATNGVAMCATAAVMCAMAELQRSRQ